MRQRRNVALLCGLLFIAGCGRNGGRGPAEERDGAELVALAVSAHDAVARGDEAALGALFRDSGQARTVWRSMQKWQEDRDAETMSVLLAFPGIERRTVGMHVRRLHVRFWFDLTEANERIRDILRTEWTFARSTDSAEWRIESLRIDPGRVTYGDVLADAERLPAGSFAALRMNGTESVDPEPVFARVLQACAAGDMAALKACSIDGVLDHAFRKRVNMPTLENGDNASGRYNREQSEETLNQLSNAMREFSGRFQIAPEALLPSFATYRIGSLPDRCRKLGMRIDLDGEQVSPKLDAISVVWSVARPHGVWVNEAMHVASYAVR